MPSATLKTTKSGKRFYEIRCHVSRSKGTFTSRWYVPDGWSEKAIQRELAKVSAEFERQCKAGEVLTRADQKAQEAEAQRLAEIEAAKIVTLRQYCKSGNPICSFSLIQASAAASAAPCNGLTSTFKRER